MERALRVKDEYTCYKDLGLFDMILDWLEREDGELEIMAGFGLCLATVTYFIAHLFQAVMIW